MNGDVSLPGHTSTQRRLVGRPFGLTAIVDGWVRIIIEDTSATLVCATNRVANSHRDVAKHRAMWVPYVYAVSRPLLRYETFIATSIHTNRLH